MDLYLQFGYGMKQHTIELAKYWGEATVILSPRDIMESRIDAWSKEFKKYNVKRLFDPQCYFPHSNHSCLKSYGYLSGSALTNLGENSTKVLLKKIKNLNDRIETQDYILPAVYTKEIGNEWFNKHNDIAKLSKDIMPDKLRYMTIVTPATALYYDKNIVEKILFETEKWPVDGYYLALEHPEDKYLVDTPVWLNNMLDLCAGLKLQKRKVILGHSNHQMLCASVAKVDAIASGSWLNVRMFKNKYDEEDGIARRNTWYYYPQALSEYNLRFLDLAYSKNILNHLKPSSDMANIYSSMLFEGKPPALTNFNEQSAFRHYLISLKKQVEISVRDTFEETVAAQEVLLATAEQNIAFLRTKGVSGLNRDFRDIVDVNRAAIKGIEESRGFVLSQEWSQL